MTKPTKIAYQNAANNSVDVLYSLFDPRLENSLEMVTIGEEAESLIRFDKIDHSLKDDIAKAVRKSFKRAIDEFGGSPEFEITLIKSRGRASLVSRYSLTISNWDEDLLEIVLIENSI